MAILIRALCVRDWPALSALFLQVRSQTFTWNRNTPFHLSDLEQQIAGEAVSVALNEAGQLVGFISLWRVDQFIHHLYVDRQWQGLGIGHQLLQSLPGWPHTRYQLKCLQLNQSAAGFYRACGFIDVGTGCDEDGEYIVFEFSTRNRS